MSSASPSSSFSFPPAVCSKLRRGARSFLATVAVCGVALATSAALFCSTVEAAAASPAKTDLYATLQVPRHASEKEIKKAFRDLTRRLHPDTNKAANAREEYTQVLRAYDILSDTDKRRLYDATGQIAGEGGATTAAQHKASAAEVFSMFFGGGHFQRQRRSAPLRDSTVHMRISDAVAALALRGPRVTFAWIGDTRSRDAHQWAPIWEQVTTSPPYRHMAAAYFRLDAAADGFILDELGLKGVPFGMSPAVIAIRDGRVLQGDGDAVLVSEDSAAMTAALVEFLDTATQAVREEGQRAAAFGSTAEGFLELLKRERFHRVVVAINADVFSQAEAAVVALHAKYDDIVAVPVHPDQALPSPRCARNTPVAFPSRTAAWIWTATTAPDPCQPAHPIPVVQSAGDPIASLLRAVRDRLSLPAAAYTANLPAPASLAKVPSPLTNATHAYIVGSLDEEDRKGFVVTQIVSSRWTRPLSVLVDGIVKTLGSSTRSLVRHAVTLDAAYASEATRHIMYACPRAFSADTDFVTHPLLDFVVLPYDPASPASGCCVRAGTQADAVRLLATFIDSNTCAFRIPPQRHRAFFEERIPAESFPALSWGATFSHWVRWLRRRVPERLLLLIGLQLVVLLGTRGVGPLQRFWNWLVAPPRPRAPPRPTPQPTQPASQPRRPQPPPPFGRFAHQHAPGQPQQPQHQPRASTASGGQSGGTGAPQYRGAAASGSAPSSPTQPKRQTVLNPFSDADLTTPGLVVLVFDSRGSLARGVSGPGSQAVVDACEMPEARLRHVAATAWPRWWQAMRTVPEFTAAEGTARDGVVFVALRPARMRVAVKKDGRAIVPWLEQLLDGGEPFPYTISDNARA